MEPVGNRHEWQISTDGPPWVVIDWAGKRHEFDTRDEGLAFIDRDKRLFDQYARDAHSDVTDQITYALENGTGVESAGEHEQTAGTAGEAKAVAEGVGGQGNRRSRRRARRSSNSKKASGRGR